MPWCRQHICLSTPPPRDVQLQKMPYPSPLRMHSLPLKLLVFNAILKKKRKTWWKGRRRLKTAFSSRDRNRIWKKKAKLGNRKWITRFIPYDRVSIPHRDKLCQYLVISNLKVAKILEKYTAEQHATSQRCSPPFCDVYVDRKSVMIKTNEKKITFTYHHGEKSFNNNQDEEAEKQYSTYNSKYNR